MDDSSAFSRPLQTLHFWRECYLYVCLRSRYIRSFHLRWNKPEESMGTAANRRCGDSGSSGGSGLVAAFKCFFAVPSPFDIASRTLDVDGRRRATWGVTETEPDVRNLNGRTSSLGCLFSSLFVTLLSWYYSVSPPLIKHHFSAHLQFLTSVSSS